MTIVKGNVTMTGSLGNVTFYTRRGSDKVIMQAKGGATRAKMAANPKFEGLRKHQKEFGGCSGFGKYTRSAFGDLRRVADYNLSAVLTGIGRNLMKLDTASEVGKRSLYLSRNKEALEGFNFNRTNPFTSVLRVIPRVDLDRANLTGKVTIPRINTETDLMNFRKMPFFRILVSIGALVDLVYNPTTGSYEPMSVEMNGISRVLTGDWHSTQAIVPEQTLTVALPEERIAFLTEHVSMLLCMAVEFGNVGPSGEPVEAKYAGCGKVVKVG
jgi:hypothetical protein